MKSSLKGFVLGSIVLSLTGAQGAFAAASGPVADYVRIQEALSTDKSQEEVKGFAQALARQAKDPELRKAAEAVAGAKDIAEARKNFKSVSTKMIRQFEAQPRSAREGYEVVYCPMAGAKWIQAKGPIQNPYYGKEMAECGEKVK